MTAAQIEIFRGEPGRPYETIGSLKAKKGAQPTPFNKRPSEDDLNIKLRAKANRKGATAIINVHYRRGVIFTSWRGLTATGTAVKYS
jgi:hypothetical protein